MITVVIPVGQSTTGLVGTLSGLVSAASEGVVRDVVLVGDSELPDLAEIADVTGAELIPHRGNRAEALRLGGMAKVRGQWLLFIEPGVRLEADWFHAAAEFIEHSIRTGRSDKVATFGYRSQSKQLTDRLKQLAFALRTRTLGLPARDQGMLIDRHFYRHLGGHEDLDALADAALWRRLGARRVTRLSAGLLPVDQSAPAGTRPKRHWLRMALVCLKFPPNLVARLI